MACNSLIRFAAPLNRKMPSTSVANHRSNVSIYFVAERTHSETPTFFFQEHTTFGHNYWYISVHEVFSVFICEGNCNVGVRNAILKGNTEYSALYLLCCC